MDVKRFSSVLRNMTAPLEGRVLLMIGRGVLKALGEGNHLRAKHGGLGDEVMDNREVFHDYGFTAMAHAGAEVIFACLAGNRSRSVVLRIADARYRLDGLKAGEVAIYDDLGQSIHLTREGIVVKGAGLPVTIKDTPKVRAECSLFECTGDIIDRCDSGGKAMAAMRASHNSHVHRENDNGGPTDTPMEQV